VDQLLAALHALKLDLALAVVAGAAAALLLVQLLRARRRARRVRRLVGRASSLGTGQAPRALTSPDVLSGRDDVADLARAFHTLEQRLLEERTAREHFVDRALEEVKRPLALLSTSLDLALRRRPEVPELTAALRDAQREAERIARLATRVAMVQTMARSLKRGPTDLTRVARAVYQAALPVATQRGLKLQLETPPELAVSGDAEALTLALSELVANAVQASRHGGAVWLSVSKVAGGARAAVRDEGPGIPRERRALLFEPFSRGPHGWNPAGLGLAIVREVARGHGGEVRVVEEEVGAHLELDVPAG
jgi:signal transduction histidine kinase